MRGTCPELSYLHQKIIVGMLKCNLKLNSKVDFNFLINKIKKGFEKIDPEYPNEILFNRGLGSVRVSKNNSYADLLMDIVDTIDDIS